MLELLTARNYRAAPEVRLAELGADAGIVTSPTSPGSTDAQGHGGRTPASPRAPAGTGPGGCRDKVRRASLRTASGTTTWTGEAHPMYQLTALYNHPSDPAAFDKHYRDVHSVLAAKIPGVTSFTMTWCGPGPDGQQPPYHLIAVLQAESKAAMDQGLSGPEGAAAVADLENFAAAGVEMLFGETDRVV